MSTLREIGLRAPKLPCLVRLEEEGLTMLDQTLMLRRIDRDHVMFEESDTLEFFYIVSTGAIKLYRASREGREVLIRIIGPGECTCCAPLFGDRRYFVNAKALEESTLIAVPAEKFAMLLRTKLNKTGLSIISCLSGRLAHLLNLISDLTFKDVEQRVLISLLRVSREKAAEDDRAFLPFTHSDIASMTGTVREVVSRTMSKLKKEGIITSSTVRGFAVDTEKLSKLLNDK